MPLPLQPVRVLIIDDNAEDYRLLKAQLESACSCECQWIDNYEAGLTALVNNAADVCLLDYRLGQQDGLDLLDAALDGGSRVPIIMITGQGNDDVDQAALERGAADYLVKGDYSAEMLARSVRYAINRAKSLNRLRESESRYRTVVELTSDYVFRSEIHPDGKPSLVWSNRRYEKIFGYEWDELAEMGSLEKLIHPEDAHLAQQHTDRIVLTGSSTVTLRVIERDGEVRWLQLDTRWEGQDAETGVTHVITAARDITEARQAQQFLRDRDWVLSLIAQGQPLRLILSLITQMIERQYNRRNPEDIMCVITLGDKTQQKHCVHINLPDTFLLALDEIDLFMYKPFAALPNHPGSSLMIPVMDELPEDNPLRELALQYGIHAGWLMPIKSSAGELVGMMMQFRRTPYRPTDNDQQITDTARRLTGIAIENQLMTDRANYEARFDLLTGLPNKRHLLEKLEDLLVVAREHAAALAVLALNIGNYRLVAQTLGGDIGDLMLKQVAQRLRFFVEPEYTLARTGADEFVIVMDAVDGDSDAASMAKNLLKVVSEPFLAGHHELSAHLNIGISMFPRDGDKPDALLRKADSALRLSMANGRSGTRFYEDAIGRSSVERLMMESALRRALENNDLLLHYQPQIASATGQVVACEALLRWRTENGIMTPSRFIPIAEDSGLIVEIGAWVLREACLQQQRWADAGHTIQVAVNVSVVQFYQPDFVDIVLAALEESGTPPEMLCLEITETFFNDNVESVSARLRELRSLGVQVAIDDFGSGFSSFGQLLQMPLDVLKIDQYFVQRLGGDAEQRIFGEAVVRGIVSMAHSLKLNVVAEGVETPLQRDLLRDLNVEYLQGYLYSRPGLPDDIMKQFSMAFGD